MLPFKTKIATAVSIVGVLGAGSAAALVNTQILDNGPTESGASAAVLPDPSSIDLTVPETPIETIPVSTVVVTTAPTTTLPEPAVPAEPAAAAPAPSGYLTAFNVGDAGVVTVDVVDGQLVLVSAEPKAGWEVTKAEDDSNDDTDELENEVHVRFRSATVRVDFEAAFVDGQIVPKVESHAIGGTTPSTTAPAPNTTLAPPPAPTSYDDDDHYEDDDRYEDDDHHEDDDHRDDGHEEERDDD